MDMAKPRPAPGDSSQPAEAADTATEQQQAAEARQPATDDIQVAQGTEVGARTRSRKAASGRAAEPSKPASPAVNEEIAGKQLLLMGLEHATCLQQQQAQRLELIGGSHQTS